MQPQQDGPENHQEKRYSPSLNVIFKQIHLATIYAQSKWKGSIHGWSTLIREMTYYFMSRYLTLTHLFQCTQSPDPIVKLTSPRSLSKKTQFHRPCMRILQTVSLLQGFTEQTGCPPGGYLKKRNFPLDSRIKKNYCPPKNQVFRIMHIKGAPRPLPTMHQNE